MSHVDENQKNQELDTLVKFRTASTFSPYNDASVLSMDKTDDGSVWVCSRFNREMLLVNQGNVTDVIYADVGLKDFSVSSRTGHIWMLSYHDDKIREIQVPDGRSFSRFTTDKAATCICVTFDDHLVLGFQGHIAKCTQSGQVVCKTSDESTPPVCFPHGITECPVTKHLAVVDLDSARIGGNNKPSLYILNDTLQHLYSYHGEVPEQEAQGREPFDPKSVCYTNRGQLVVTDGKNGSVLLLSGKGDFLQTLFTHTAKASAACVHNNGDVYVSFEDKNVHVLRQIDL